MNGKRILVTGATSGIGFYTTLELARMGGAVTLVGRDEGKCIDSVEFIKKNTNNLNVDYLIADLSSQSQVRAITEKYIQRADHLDVLVNNAGGAFLFRKESVDGIEMTFALNHLAYFLLTNLLLEALKASPSARIINVSSGAHYGQHIDFDDLQMKRFYNPVAAYGRSKLANILFTYELSRRLAGTQVTANALTPGMVATDIWKKVTPLATLLVYPIIRKRGKTPLEGAQTSIYLASSPEVKGITGKYYANCLPKKSDPVTYDVSIAQKLWQVSSELVGL